MQEREIKKIEYDNDWPIVAICYDFDKTLSPKDMQNFSLIPKLKCKINLFWTEAGELAKKNGMDKIIAYMKLIVDKAKAVKEKITISDFNELGKTIELFNGVDSWFDRINDIGKSLQINVEHYIISAGLKEIIDGTPIRKYFTGVYASEFYYDEYGAPCWPCQVVNYTSKTQYLFRISKNCLDLSDEDRVNNYIADSLRRIPFKRFIYIGDSETDIPAMKIVKQGGGTSIGVYNPNTCKMDKVSKLLQQDRIDFLMPADYSENSRIENVLKMVLEKIKKEFDVEELNDKQKDFVNDLDELDSFIDYTKDFLSESKLNLEDIKKLEKQGKKIIKRIKKERIDKHLNVAGELEINTYFNEKKQELEKIFEDKTKKLLKHKKANEARDKEQD